MIGTNSYAPLKEAGGLLEKARAALKLGKSNEVLSFALEGMKHDPSQEQASELNRIAAEALMRQGRLNQARTYAESGLEFGRASGDYRAAYACAVTLGRVFLDMTNYPAAEQMWSEALTLAGMRKDKPRQALALLDMAIIDQRRGNHKRALNSLEAVRKNLKKSKSKRLIARCCSRMSYSLIVEERFEEAVNCCEEMESLAVELGAADLKASASFRKGSIYLKQDKYPEAITALKVARKLFTQAGDRRNLALVVCELARIHVYSGIYDKADALLQEVLEMAETIETDDVFVKAKITLAERYALSGHWEEARGYYHEAITKIRGTDYGVKLDLLHNSFEKIIRELGLKLAGLKELLASAKNMYVLSGLHREAEKTERWLSKIPLTG